MARMILTVDSVTKLLPDVVRSWLASTYVAQANLTVTPGASVSGANTGDEPYAKDAKVTHKDQRWTSNLDGNVWEPGVYGWTLAPQ